MDSGTCRRARSGGSPASVSKPEQIALYCDGSYMRNRIERLLEGVHLQAVESRQRFAVRLARGSSPGIVALRKCSVADAAWLRDAVGQALTIPSCVVVAPLGLSNLQSLRALGRDIFRVVWDEEADDRLACVLKEVMDEWCPDPLTWLGRKIVAAPGLRPSLRTVVAEVCLLSSEVSPPPPPKRTVAELARLVHLSPVTLCRYWKADVPLRCGPKRLLSWASLLWAVERRTQAKWDAVAGQMGVRRRTLERRCSGLADCTLARAARDPLRVPRRFEAWVAEVSDFKKQ